MVVDVIDAVTKRILHSKLINSFQSGIYLRYNVRDIYSSGLLVSFMMDTEIPIIRYVVQYL